MPAITAERAFRVQRPDFDLDPMCRQVSDGVVDRTGPLEAKVTVTRPDCFSRRVRRVRSGAMNAEILVAEAVNEPATPPDDFRADDIPVERVRAFPIGYGDHAVVDDSSSH